MNLESDFKNMAEIHNKKEINIVKAMVLTSVFFGLCCSQVDQTVKKVGFLEFMLLYMFVL